MFDTWFNQVGWKVHFIVLKKKKRKIRKFITLNSMGHDD